jgi:hypothetical protein
LAKTRQWDGSTARQPLKTSGPRGTASGTGATDLPGPPAAIDSGEAVPRQDNHSALESCMIQHSNPPGRAATAIAAVLAASPAVAALSAKELAKLAQNPVGNRVSMPFQNNTNLNFGPERKTRNVLNIQPVNTQLSACYNVVTPDNGANWQIRAQLPFMFPQ